MRTVQATTPARTVLLALFTLVASLAPTGCTTNAATGRSQFNLLSEDQEIALGEEAQPQLTREYGGEVTDPELRAYISQIGVTLLQDIEDEYKDLPWEFTLLDSDVINAFALPGGKVFVSRGLAEKLDNEAMLASVIGHEIGHVTARHVNERMGRQTGIQIGAGVLGLLVGGESATVQQAAGLLVNGAGVYALKFDRAQESESDALGIRYMTRAGYNPIGALQMMGVLREASQSGERPPEFLSTHPYAETRVDRIREILETEHPRALENPEQDVYAERFQQRFLSKVSLLPPAPDADLAALIAPAWCGVCTEHTHTN